MSRPAVTMAQGAPMPERRNWAPWGMSAPALLLFAVMLVVPLILTTILSFNVYNADSGPVAGTFTVEHYVHIVTDSYYYEIFWRTLWISAVVTVICIAIGAPEAYILSKMRAPWRSIFLLIILAPLLISVVAGALLYGALALLVLGWCGVRSKVMGLDVTTGSSLTFNQRGGGDSSFFVTVGGSF